MSDTPRTDERSWATGPFPGDPRVVTEKFARELEMEIKLLKNRSAVDEQEEIGRLRSALRYVAENHHEGEGEFEKVVWSALKPDSSCSPWRPYAADEDHPRDPLRMIQHLRAENEKLKADALIRPSDSCEEIKRLHREIKAAKEHLLKHIPREGSNVDMALGRLYRALDPSFPAS